MNSALRLVLPEKNSPRHVPSHQGVERLSLFFLPEVFFPPMVHSTVRFPKNKTKKKAAEPRFRPAAANVDVPLSSNEQ